jgi:hypothetical protein
VRSAAGIPVPGLVYFAATLALSVDSAACARVVSAPIPVVSVPRSVGKFATADSGNAPLGTTGAEANVLTPVIVCGLAKSTTNCLVAAPRLTVGSADSTRGPVIVSPAFLTSAGSLPV